ncbi:RimK/LysX family protein [Roseovarius sp. MMSF_3281]|uniref:ATP-dependent zinc protease family protein n=1 Tax=Roseovarius sp. MMSF_3281 TaxID=3046694 RepID=UPI00273DC05D|nr:RimK/LysX family protein [Roseovarius sp. MMSF_3281]
MEIDITYPGSRVSRRAAVALVVCQIFAPAHVSASDAADTIRIVGRATEVGILDEDIRILAKVDTGADSTSIDARNIEEFQRGGEDWVRFETPLGDDGRSVVFEREIIKGVRILRSGSEDVRRHVVELSLCVGEFEHKTEVNLANREGLEYRMLLGRGFLLRGNFLVNPAQDGAVDPACDD